MKIELKKFGTTLVSRQAGREAYLAYRPSLSKVGDQETVEVDFSGVTTFSPSWGDEFLGPLSEKYGNNLKLLNTSGNPSVVLTLKLLEKVKTRNFVVVS